MENVLSRACDPPRHSSLSRRATSPSRQRVCAPVPVVHTTRPVVVTIDSVLEHLGELSGDAETDADHWSCLIPDLDSLFAAANNVRGNPSEDNWFGLFDELALLELGWWGTGAFLDCIRIDDASSDADREHCLDVLNSLEVHYELIDDYIHEAAANAVVANEMSYA